MDGVTLRFSRSHNFIGTAIEWWTGGWPSHVDFVVEEGLLGAKPIGGVAIRQETGDRDILDLWLPAPGGADFARSELGTGYDWLGLLGAAFQVETWHHPHLWFCSELVTASLEMSGFPIMTEWDLSHPRVLTPWQVLERARPLGKVLRQESLPKLTGEKRV